MATNKIGILKKIEKIEGDITTPKGFYAGGLHCGVKRKRLDLGWIYSDVPANAAAVYTTNLFQAAPIVVTKESIQVSKSIQGVIVNSGNANACTGEEGYKNALQMRAAFAQQVQVPEEFIAVSSTGVIGEQLPIEKIITGIEFAGNKRESSANDFEKAILTTDTVQKRCCVQLDIDGEKVTIAGAAKGSGMIEPNMATMLAFITTDAQVEQKALQRALKVVTDQTFNMITVDGDSSTNDMVLLLANGLAGNDELIEEHPDWPHFLQGLKTVCQTLAMQIASDGEGATKLVEAHVTGAASEDDAKKIAKAIIGSNLVKTAVFGTDPNWGRIIAAIGYSGAKLSIYNIHIFIGPFQVLQNGSPIFFDEEQAKIYLQENDVVQIFVHLQEGNGSAIGWGCDLTYDYVKINASYRT